MKRTIKIATIVIVSSMALLLLGKHEAFLEMHYDTLASRIIERTSILGITINETTSLRREGYSDLYRSIYGVKPPDDRWHSVSMRPIRKTTIFTVYHISVMTPQGVLIRDSIAGDIFERFRRDHSDVLARDAFTALEELLPSTKELEELNREELISFRRKAERIHALKDLIDSPFIPRDHTPWEESTN